MVRRLVAAAMLFSECGRVMQTLPHAVFVFLDEFLLVVLIFHPVLAWDDKIGCDSTLWTRPAPKKDKQDLVVLTQSHIFVGVIISQCKVALSDYCCDYELYK